MSKQNRKVQFSIPKRVRFDKPESGKLRLNIFGEIQTAINFNAEYLYIDFELSLPQSFTLNGTQSKNEKIEYSTHCASPMAIKQSYCSSYNCYNFCFPFEFELETTDLSMSAVPIMYFQVNSLDSWDRYRLEGYGYLHIPKIAGSHQIKVDTWRPVGSLTDELRRTFIGGGRLMTDRKLVFLRHSDTVYNAKATPTKFDARVGWETQPMGSVDIHMEVIRTTIEKPQLSTLFSKKSYLSNTAQIGIKKSKTRSKKQFSKTHSFAIKSTLEEETTQSIDSTDITAENTITKPQHKSGYSWFGHRNNESSVSSTLTTGNDLKGALNRRSTVAHPPSRHSGRTHKHSNIHHTKRIKEVSAKLAATLKLDSDEE